MNQQELKFEAAKNALKYVTPDTIIGIGSGSTVTIFISLLNTLPFRIKGAVAASVESERNLTAAGIKVLNANQVDKLSVYIDGADEVTPEGYMTKGGGAALVREKILANLADKFVCIVDQTKCTPKLGTKFALPVEVIPMAQAQIMRHLQSLGGNPVYRDNVVTDNGNIIIDVHDFVIENPKILEASLNNTPGIVDCGIFSHNRANVVIVASEDGVKETVLS